MLRRHPKRDRRAIKYLHPIYSLVTLMVPAVALTLMQSLALAAEPLNCQSASKFDP